MKAKRKQERAMEEVLNLAAQIASFDFFFSSRRRHTRWTGDWSSDVCSSDLPESDSRVARVRARNPRRARQLEPKERSEERRVGKECRCRWLPYHYKKKMQLHGMKNGPITSRKVHNVQV